MKYYYSIVSCLLVFLGISQKPSISLSVDSKNVQIGNPITFTVKSNIEGNVEIDFPDEFILGYGSMNGMEQEMDHNTGAVSTIYYFSQNGAFKENGNFNVIAYIKNKKAIYKSNKLTIKVEKESASNDDEQSKKNFKQAVFGIIQRSKTKIYEGEFVVLESKVFSKLNINMLESYQSFEVDGLAEMKEIEKSNNLLLRKENFRGNQVLTFTYGKQLVFPSAIGKLKIKPFEMSLQYHDGGIFSDRIAFTSNSSFIEVVPLPENAPKDFIGGVGKFDLAYKIDKNKSKQNDVLVLELIVKGIGNIQNTNKPRLNLPKGIIIYGDPEIKENIEYGNNGAEGYIVYTFNLQVLEAGKKKIPAISISYFDTEQKKYIRKINEEINIEVLPSKSTFANLPVKEKLVENAKEKVPFIEELLIENESFYNSKWFWPSVLSPFFLAFIGGIFIRKRAENKGKVNEKTSKKRVTVLINLQLDDALKLNRSGKIKESFQKIDEALKSLAFLFVSDENQNITKYELLTILKENGVSENQIYEINTCLLTCEEVRYSYDNEFGDFDQTILKAKNSIKNLS